MQPNLTGERSTLASHIAEATRLREQVGRQMDCLGIEVQHRAGAVSPAKQQYCHARRRISPHSTATLQ